MWQCTIFIMDLFYILKLITILYLCVFVVVWLLAVTHYRGLLLSLLCDILWKCGPLNCFFYLWAGVIEVKCKHLFFEQASVWQHLLLCIRSVQQDFEEWLCLLFTFDKDVNILTECRLTHCILLHLGNKMHCWLLGQLDGVKRAFTFKWIEILIRAF